MFIIDDDNRVKDFTQRKKKKQSRRVDYVVSLRLNFILSPLREIK